MGFISATRAGSTRTARRISQGRYISARRRRRRSGATHGAKQRNTPPFAALILLIVACAKDRGLSLGKSMSLISLAGGAFVCRVLQGHVALAGAVFPAGTPGLMLEMLARGPLWQDGAPDVSFGLHYVAGSLTGIDLPCRAELSARHWPRDGRLFERPRGADGHRCIPRDFISGFICTKRKLTASK